MKGVIVFNHLNDVVYVYACDVFKTYLHKRAVETRLVEDDAVPDTVDPDLIMQLFSPLVASQRFMESHVKDPYHCIELEDSTKYVFQQYHEYVLMAVGSVESPDFLHRKLLILQKIIGFLFGPVTEEIRPAKLAKWRKRWNFITRLLDTWCHLYSEEQGFLMEAVERLQVNQLLNGRAVEVLESALSSMKSAGDKHCLHALLIVNSKLLALYSSRNAQELQSADILMLTLLVQTLFPSSQKLEDLFSRSYAPASQTQPAGRQSNQDGDKFESASEGPEEGSDNVEHFSTPHGSPRVSPNLASSLPSRDSTEEYFDGNSLDNTEPEASLIGKSLAVDREFGAHDLYSGQFHQMTVMVTTPVCKFTPNLVRCAEVMPGVALVLVSELGGARQSGIIYQSLNILRSVLSPRWVSDRSQASLILNLMETNMKKLQEFNKKAKGSSVEKLIANIVKQWDKARKSGLQSFLEDEGNNVIPANLERILSQLLSSLKQLFRALYLQSRALFASPDIERNIAGVVEKLLKHVQTQLTDYSDYLAVKSQRNLTITSYVEDFPGLAHFIHVDRLNHQLTAPSINVEEDKPDQELLNMNKIIKEKVWDMVPRMQQKLRQGYLTQTLREGNFFFSYYLWFEDGSGSPLPPQQPFQGLHDNHQPGILTGNFYKLLCRQCFPRIQRDRMLPCFELVTVHVGLVSPPIATEQCQKLAALLYETSTAASSPIGLL